MAWIKYIIIIILFYFLAVLQNSFFTHFNLFGSGPNLVFILFFILIFFSAKSEPSLGQTVIFYAIIAGLFMDLFSPDFFGPSIILLLAEGFVLKKTLGLLREKKGDSRPFAYFLPLFFVAIIIYNLSLNLFFARSLSQSFITGIIYNMAIASATFFIYKKITATSADTRQLTLFRK